MQQELELELEIGLEDTRVIRDTYYRETKTKCYEASYDDDL